MQDENLSKSARDALSELYHLQETEGYSDLPEAEKRTIRDAIELLKKLKG